MHERLAKLANTSEQEMNLAEAALLIAMDEYPGLDVDAYLRQLDELATSVQQRLPAQAGLEDTLVTLNQFLFVEQGFSGDTDDYDDPRNSFLNEVLDRKRGIPITLSILYMEVGRRLGLPLKGVSFPGHFLVKVAGEGDDIVLDPYNGGEIVGMDQLAKMLYALYGGKVAFHPDFLEPATKKQILIRMLNNLKVIYLKQNDWAKGLAVVDRLVILDPGSAEDLRDRGMMYARMECFRQALEDLQSYLQLAPGARDAQEVRKQIGDLAKQVAQIH